MSPLAGFSGRYLNIPNGCVSKKSPICSEFHADFKAVVNMH